MGWFSVGAENFAPFQNRHIKEIVENQNPIILLEAACVF
jgi:hypothetical protein